MFYLLDVRDQVAAQLKETSPNPRVADVTKTVSNMWKDLPAEQKAVRIQNLASSFSRN